MAKRLDFGKQTGPLCDILGAVFSLQVVACRWKRQNYAEEIRYPRQDRLMMYRLRLVLPAFVMRL